MVRMNKSSFECKPFIYLVSVVLALCFCFDTTQETLRNPAYLFALAVLVIVFFTRRGKIDMSDISPIYIILAVGTLIKIFYVLYTHWSNPETGKSCAIDESIDYLIRLRDEYREFMKGSDA